MSRRALAALLVALALAPPALAGEAVLTVGLTGKYPPFNYVDAQGELAGFDVEMARAICGEMGRRCEFRTLQWDGILGALLAGRIDVVIGSMAVTQERAKAVRFTVPYYESGAQLFVRPREQDPTREGFAIGVTLGTTYEQHVRRAYPTALVRTYKGDTEVLQDVAAGRLDAMVTDRLVGAHMIRTFGVALEPFGPLLFEEKIAIPVRPERERLKAELDAAVTRLRASPWYAQLVARYFGAGVAARAVPETKLAVMAWLLARGVVGTLGVCVLGITLGLGAAVLLAFLLGAGPRVRRVVSAGVDFVRATPFMVQLFAIYFGLPTLGLAIGAWASATFAIALHSAAYLSVVIVTAYQSVPVGQRHAAKALGLTPAETLRHVLVPQMLPVLTVPALNTVVAMIKDSAIVSVIGVYELTLQVQQLISTTFRPLELYGAAALLYFAITYPLLLAGRAAEARFRQRGLLHG